MQTLCGSLPPYCPKKIGTNETKMVYGYDAIPTLIFDLMHGLIDEKVVLEWDLISCSDSNIPHFWRVQDVRLLTL